MHWLAKAFVNYAAFVGRATRREFWSFALLFAVVTGGARFIDSRDGEIVPVAAGMGVLELTAFIALLLPFVSGSVRRLHDTGRSGWWLLFLYAPYLGFVVAGPNLIAQAAASAALLVGAIMLLVLLAMAGEQGANRYGDDPRGEIRPA
ncbi:MAG: hypothetical protein RL481_432 [Pseudomonadota bacterium]|jgi:uncharacterized membrane protein YhaH (DUF805 family)